MDARYSQRETLVTEAAAGVEPADNRFAGDPLTARAYGQFEPCFRQDSNLRLQLRRLVSYPLDYGSVRAPGWIRTSSLPGVNQALSH
jgi:hypothetical protein